MKRMFLVSLVAVASLLFCGEVSYAKDLKVGVVDLQKVLEQSTSVRELNKKYEGELKAEEEVLAKKREELEKKTEDLEKQKSMLEEAVRIEKENKLRQEFKNLQRYAKDKQEELQRKGTQLMQAVMKDLSIIVQEIGKEKGYTVILERSSGGVAYFAESTDITAHVVKEYEKKHKK